MSRTAWSFVPRVLLEAAAAEKAEQGKHEHDNQDDPEQAHWVLLSLNVSLTL